jgi:hypothetical protein
MVEGAGVTVVAQQAEGGELADRFGGGVHAVAWGGVGAQRVEVVRAVMVEGAEDP